MKKLIVIVLVAVFCVPMLALARRDTGPPEWTFDNVSDLADWRDTYDIAPINTITKVKSPNGVERNVLRIVPTGDKPYVYLGGVPPANWEPFNGYEHATVYMGVRIQKTDTWQVDYVTGRNTEFNNDQSKKLVVNASPDFMDLKFDMHWDGMISGLRLHFGSNKNPIEIDYVSLLGPVTVNQPPKKLATTWGKVKDLF